MRTHLVAVVVAYHPEPEALAVLLDALTPQVAATVLVDNGAGQLAGWLTAGAWPGVRYLPLGDNLGIATALNRGIREARMLQADHVLFFDQDSVPTFDMVVRLLESLAKLLEDGEQVAAVGPRYTDPRNPSRRCFYRLEGWRLRMLDCQPDDTTVETDTLISSGMLIPMSVIDSVGEMEDDMFIDQVDLEWCLRAKHFGYRSFGVCNARLNHALGEMPIRFLHKSITHHSPLRHYYIYRNAIRLLGRAYVPLGWKMVFLRMMIGRLGYYVIFVPPRLDYLKHMFKGVFDGLCNRGGRLAQF